MLLRFLFLVEDQVQVGVGIQIPATHEEGLGGRNNHCQVKANRLPVGIRKDTGMSMMVEAIGNAMMRTEDQSHPRKHTVDNHRAVA